MEREIYFIKTGFKQMPKMNLKKIRDRLWKACPFCVYCGMITILPQNIVKGRDKFGKLRYYPDNMTTIDHLRSRYDPKRQIHDRNERRYILSCLKCNNERGKEETKKIKIKKLWKLSKRYPQNKGNEMVAFLNQPRISSKGKG